MMRDSSLKEMLFKHYWKQRCFVQPEVEIYNINGSLGAKKLITDVDVFVLQPSATTLSFERLLGDCKTLKGQSAINRAFWLSGLRGYLKGKGGVVLLDIPNIESDHKLAANAIDVRVMNAKDFAVYDKSINYPEGSEGVNASIQDVFELRNYSKKHPKLTPLTNHLYRDVWKETSFGEIMRHSLAQTRKVSSEFDPNKREHSALICDAAAIFSVGLAECCGTIFHQYLHPTEKALLSDSLKVLIWGGREQYDLASQLRAKLLAVSGKAQPESEDSLELPQWNLLVQLVRHILDNPKAAFYIPWFLRQLSFDLMKGREFSVSLPTEDIVTAKYAMLTFEYFCKACKLPSEFKENVGGILLRLQTDLALTRDGKVSKPIAPTRVLRSEDVVSNPVGGEVRSQPELGV
ncbi:hypothetical protein FEM03_08005 [Phragmitibacter flavus]|uniref:Uncharacterized protein n=1 Tax=Phragmitibacter flavus TaxID=2576071 RepID=A0A5R8KIL8_9BACT|nr:hypothetical protein [Phragmitibacter flavus]TLD71459.1 hypothetical protein FEM03_08005 [Phragmitibacter flavus]